MANKLKKDLSKDGTYRDTPADKYVVKQLADIFDDYFKSKNLPQVTKDEFENMLFKDKAFHNWLFETHQMYFLYKPLTNSWELADYHE